MLPNSSQKLGVRRADVVVHDIGGGVVRLIAVNYVEKLRRLVLPDSVCFDAWSIPEFEQLHSSSALIRRAGLTLKLAARQPGRVCRNHSLWRVADSR